MDSHSQSACCGVCMCVNIYLAMGEWTGMSVLIHRIPHSAEWTLPALRHTHVMPRGTNWLFFSNFCSFFTSTCFWQYIPSNLNVACEKEFIWAEAFIQHHTVYYWYVDVQYSSWLVPQEGMKTDKRGTGSITWNACVCFWHLRVECKHQSEAPKDTDKWL